ncbi:MAG: HupE/UreJ family protein [Acidobacteriota bacterium]
MKRSVIAAALLWAVWLVAAPVSADLAYPARLDVTEREPGVYDISFTLPIVEGRKLRAEPILPPTCRDVTPRARGVSSGGFTSTWSVQCEPASLAGEAIFVDGLLGTQTDLAFKLTMLDGRTFSQILRPSRPGFLVPGPPSLVGLAEKAIVGGMRRTLRHFHLWLLFAAAAMLGAKPRALAAAAGAFAVGHLVSQWAGGHGWLEVTPLIRDAFTWATIAVPAIRLTGAGEGAKGWLQPPWAIAFLLGMLFGAAKPEALPVEGLSNGEQLLALILFAAGTAAAVLFMAAAACELRAVIRTARGDSRQAAASRIFGYVVGSLATGMLLVEIVGLTLSVRSGPREILELMLLAAVLGPTARIAGWPGARVVPAFVALASVGAGLGLNHVPLPFGDVVVLGTLLVLGAALASNRTLSKRWAIAVSVVAVPVHAWSTADILVENMSRSTALTGGAVLVTTCVLYASLAVARGLRAGDLPRAVRLAGTAVAALAVAWRLVEYRTWFDTEVATEAALGLLRLPLLALGLAVLALLVWPRRRRVARELGMENHSSSLHWLLLGAAFLLLPYGTAAFKNPFFEPDAPRGESARLVASRVLSDTYHAFNIADENRLYDTLSETVSGDLVDDIFLDSRRRLTAGTRKGTEVTVRDVSVLEIGEPLAGSDAEEGFSYDCRWEVIARVRHLQHVHHRQNIYNGVLTLRPEDGKWKIARVELYSEDRAVVPWKAT